MLHLAAMLARSGGEELRAVRGRAGAVAAEPGAGRRRVPGVPRSATADDALERARGRLPADVPASFAVHHARSAPAGLLEVAERTTRA